MSDITVNYWYSSSEPKLGTKFCASREDALRWARSFCDLFEGGVVRFEGFVPDVSELDRIRLTTRPSVSQSEKNTVSTCIQVTSNGPFGRCLTLNSWWIVSINDRDYEVKQSGEGHIEVFPYGGDEEPDEYRRSLPVVCIEWCDIERIHIY